MCTVTFVCVCVYARVRARVCACVDVCVRACVRVWACVCVCVCVHECVRAWADLCGCLFLCLCVRVNLLSEQFRLSNKITRQQIGTLSTFHYSRDEHDEKN